MALLTMTMEFLAGLAVRSAPNPTHHPTVINGDSGALIEVIHHILCPLSRAECLYGLFHGSAAIAHPDGNLLPVLNYGLSDHQVPWF